MNNTIPWVVVGLALLGFIYNSGILWNDVKHLKKSVDDIWDELNEIKKILIERRNNP